MLTIPTVTWDEMLNLFAMAPAGVERVAYLDGVLVTSKAGTRVGVVTTVTIPNALLTPGYYRLGGDAVSEAGVHLHEHRLRRLAQVHTHGNADTRHSPTDDEMAYSKAPGATSIVLPFHATHRPLPADGTVHVRRQDRWIALDPTAVQSDVRMVPSTVDLRPSQTISEIVAVTPRWSPKRWISAAVASVRGSR